jgi:hypothetical protein
MQEHQMESRPVSPAVFLFIFPKSISSPAASLAPISRAFPPWYQEDLTRLLAFGLRGRPKADNRLFFLLFFV